MKRTICGLLCLSLTAAACGPETDDETDSGTMVDAGPDVTDTGGGEAGGDTGADTAPDTAEDTGVMSDADGTPDTTDDAGPDADGGMETDDKPRLYAAVQGANGSGYAAVDLAADRASAAELDRTSYGQGDIALAASGDTIFAMNRRCSGPGGMADCMFDAGEVRQIGLSGGSLANDRTFTLPDGVYNPQDTARLEGSSRWAVSSYFDSRLFLFDDAGMQSSSWELSELDAGSTMMDTDPEAADMVADGDYLLVNLQRLSGFMGEENSALAVIDTANDTIVDVDPMKSGTQPLVLPGTNSFAGLVRADADTFAVGLTGSFGMEDGEIVQVDRSAPGSYGVGDTVVTEAVLGGDLSDFVMVDQTSGFALVAGMEEGSFVTRLKYFSAGSGMAQVEEVSAIGNAAGAICLTPDASQVWVADGAMGSKGFWGFDVDSRMAVNAEAFPPTTGTARSCVIR